MRVYLNLSNFNQFDFNQPTSKEYKIKSNFSHYFNITIQIFKLKFKDIIQIKEIIYFFLLPATNDRGNTEHHIKSADNMTALNLWFQRLEVHSIKFMCSFGKLMESRFLLLLRFQYLLVVVFSTSSLISSARKYINCKLLIKIQHWNNLNFDSIANVCWHWSIRL